MDANDLNPPPSGPSGPAPIPSLTLLGDRLEAAAARSIAGAPADRRRRAPLAGGPVPWRLALLPALGAVAAVVVAVSVFVVAGPTSTPAAAEMLAAAERSASLSTGRFVLDIDVRVGGSTRTVELRGAYDETADRLQAEADLTSLLGGFGGGSGGTGSGALGDLTRLEVIVADGQAYLKAPLLSTVTKSSTAWFSVDADRVDSLFGGGLCPGGSPAQGGPGGPGGQRSGGGDDQSEGSASGGAAGLLGGIPGGAGLGGSVPFATDPSALLDLVTKAGASVERVGTERIDGDDTTHYVARMRLDDAIAKLGPEAQARVQSLLASVADPSARQTVPVDVWVGSSGLVRRIVVGSAPDSPAAAQLRVDYLDSGSPVDITPPPASETSDLGPLVQGTAGQVLCR